jgi:gliding motility-associated-like protein
VYYPNDTVVLTSSSIAFSDSCFANATQFSIQDTSGLSSISWNFDDPVSGASNTATGFNVKHTFSQIANYNVRAILTNACGIDTIFKTLTIRNCDSITEVCRLYVPNAFTPNGDGKNDAFCPLSICTFQQYEFLIFNRWGELIFQTSNQPDQWDGKNKGSDCSSGVYVYFIIYKFPLQSTKSVKGKIALLR